MGVAPSIDTLARSVSERLKNSSDSSEYFFNNTIWRVIRGAGIGETQKTTYFRKIVSALSEKSGKARAHRLACRKRDAHLQVALAHKESPIAQCLYRAQKRAMDRFPESAVHLEAPRFERMLRKARSGYRAGLDVSHHLDQILNEDGVHGDEAQRYGYKCALGMMLRENRK
jgi:hypothetical protein